MRNQLRLDILEKIPKMTASLRTISAGELRKKFPKILRRRFYRALDDLVIDRKIKRMGRIKSKHGGYVRL